MAWHAESNVWLTTVRPDGAPQTSRVWFALVDDTVWIATSDGALKVRNLVADPRVTLAFDGSNAGVMTGRAQLHRDLNSLPGILAALATKYGGWDAAASEPGWGERVLVSVPVTTFRPA